MAFKLAELFVDIRTRDAKANAGLARVGRGLQRAGKMARGLAVGLAKLNAAVVTLGAVAVRTFAKFEQSMANVSAILGPIGGKFDDLTSKAKELGKTTVFSASQAAEAMESFAKAGFDADQILKATEPTLNLAAAATLSMGEAASIASNIMRGMRLPVSELNRVVDVLAVGSTSANTNVSELGEAFRNVGPVAAAAGLSIEDTTTALGLLANNGIVASDAGTKLRIFLGRMATLPADAAAGFRAMGIEVRDASGALRPFFDVMQDVSKVLAANENNAVNLAKAIGGARGFSAVLALANAMNRDFGLMRSRINDASGAAKEMAAVKLDTVAGDFKLLASALEAVQIAIGEKLRPVIRAITQGIQSLASAMADFIDMMDDAGFIDRWLKGFARLAAELENLPTRVKLAMIVAKRTFKESELGIDNINKDIHRAVGKGVGKGLTIFGMLTGKHDTALIGQQMFREDLVPEGISEDMQVLIDEIKALAATERKLTAELEKNLLKRETEIATRLGVGLPGLSESAKKQQAEREMIGQAGRLGMFVAVARAVMPGIVKKFGLDKQAMKTVAEAVSETDGFSSQTFSLTGIASAIQKAALSEKKIDEQTAEQKKTTGEIKKLAEIEEDSKSALQSLATSFKGLFVLS